MTACGKKSSDSSDLSGAKSSEPMTLSEAFSKRGIWFHSYSSPQKEKTIDAVYIFNGEGHVRYYSLDDWCHASGSTTTYGEIRDKNIDEIEELAKSRFQAFRKCFLKNLSSNEDYYASLGHEEEEAIKEEVQNIGKDLPYDLHITSDETGNGAAKETLEVATDENSKVCGLDVKKRNNCLADMEFIPPSDSFVTSVYDKNFSGILNGKKDSDGNLTSSGLYALVPPEFQGFTLDQPGADGIEVD